MPTITITLPTEPRDAVRFHRYYNPESKTWELIRITEYHVGSYDAEDAPQSLSRFWEQVYFEPTHYNATRVYIEGKYIADIVLARTEQGLTVVYRLPPPKRRRHAGQPRWLSHHSQGPGRGPRCLARKM